MQEGDVRRGGCERRMTTFFGLGGALKGLKKGEWSKCQFEHNVQVIHIIGKRENGIYIFPQNIYDNIELN